MRKGFTFQSFECITILYYYGDYKMWTFRICGALNKNQNEIIEPFIHKHGQTKYFLRNANVEKMTVL